MPLLKSPLRGRGDRGYCLTVERDERVCEFERVALVIDTSPPSEITFPCPSQSQKGKKSGQRGEEERVHNRREEGKERKKGKGTQYNEEERKAILMNESPLYPFNSRKRRQDNDTTKEERTRLLQRR